MISNGGKVISRDVVVVAITNGIFVNKNYEIKSTYIHHSRAKEGRLSVVREGGREAHRDMGDKFKENYNHFLGATREMRRKKGKKVILRLFERECIYVGCIM